MIELDILRLSEFVTSFCRNYIGSVTYATRLLFEDIFQETIKRTKFTFQHWIIDVEETSSAYVITIRLPFEASGRSDVYTSLFWNNPYFENGQAIIGSSIDIHQPLQEALNMFGIKCSPALGEPITPHKWPTPPETVVVLDTNDLIEKISERLKIVIEA